MGREGRCNYKVKMSKTEKKMILLILKHAEHQQNKTMFLSVCTLRRHIPGQQVYLAGMYRVPLSLFVHIVIH